MKIDDNDDEMIDIIIGITNELKELFGNSHFQLPNGQVIIWDKFEYLSDEKAMRAAQRALGPKAKFWCIYFIYKKLMKKVDADEKYYEWDCGWLVKHGRKTYLEQAVAVEDYEKIAKLKMYATQAEAEADASRADEYLLLVDEDYWIRARASTPIDLVLSTVSDADPKAKKKVANGLAKRMFYL